MLNRVQKASFVSALRNPAFKQTRHEIINTIGNQTFYSVLGVLVALHGHAGKLPSGEWNVSNMTEKAKDLIGTSWSAQLTYQEASGMNFSQLAAVVEQDLPTRD